MEEINELVKELEKRLQEAEDIILQYEKGKVERMLMFEYIQALEALSMRINVAVGGTVRSAYEKARKAREQRNIRELGF